MTRSPASVAASRRLRGRPEVTVRVVGREAILHDPIAAKTHVVNASAARAWELCDGRTMAELVDAFAAGYGRAPAELQSDVERIVALFERLGLLE
jgi:coenzyme PQQ synthesis protein D (PqqD)